MLDLRQINGALNEAQMYINTDEYDKALTILNDMVKQVEEEKPYQEDEAAVYYSFNEPFEKVLLQELDAPKKEVRSISEHISDLYLTQGTVLLKLKDMEKSKNALQTALAWNPVDPDIYLELAEWGRSCGDEEEFCKAAANAMNWAFRKHDIGRCYLYLGYCWLDKEVRDAAKVCFDISSKLGDADTKKLAELELLELKYDNVSGATMKAMEVYSEQYNIPFSYNSKIVDIALTYADNAAADYRCEEAYYYYTILYEMTASRNVKEALRLLKEMIDKEKNMKR